MALSSTPSHESSPSVAAVLLRGAIAWMVALVVAVVFQAVLRDAMGQFASKVCVTIGINIVLAVSLTMVNGFTGQFSIGHAGFMAIGGYVAGWITYYTALSARGTSELAGGALSGLLTHDGGWFNGSDAVFLGAIIAGGLGAAIVTLGFGEIVRVLLQQTKNVIEPASPVTPENIAAVQEQVRQTPTLDLIRAVGGPLGFSGLPKFTSLFWVALAAGVTLIVAFRLKTSTVGRAFLSIREDEIAAEAMGVNTTRYKVWAFVISAFFAGVAGALFAHTSGVNLNPTELGFQKSFDVVIMVVLGGLGSISGATLAAVIVTFLSEFLRDPRILADYTPWVAGAGFALVALGMWLLIRTYSRDLRRGGPLGVLSAGGLILLLLGLAHLSVKLEWDLGRYRMIIFALTLILMMILRPKGLLGVRELWERALWREGFGRKPGSAKAVVVT